MRDGSTLFLSTGVAMLQYLCIISCIRHVHISQHFYIKNCRQLGIEYQPCSVLLIMNASLRVWLYIQLALHNSALLTTCWLVQLHCCKPHANKQRWQIIINQGRIQLIMGMVARKIKVKVPALLPPFMHIFLTPRNAWLYSACGYITYS